MIESTEFTEIRKDLESNDIITKRVTLDNIDITEDDIKNDTITVFGNRVSVGGSFFRKLAMLVNVNKF